jgi:predicted Zn-dependent protease
MAQGSQSLTSMGRPGRAHIAAIALFAATAGWTGVALAQSAGTVRPFTQQERTQGAQAHQQILQEFGDAYTGRQADYVRNVGLNVAVHTGLSTARTDYTVTLLNSPVNNAFAVPGGYVYVTRQLMGLMNNEAELAGVIGHEFAHTALRHARDRQRRAGRAGLAGILATVLGGAIGDNGGLLGALGGFLQNNAMQAAQLYTLGFSRSQESESDLYGIRYLRAAGYDPLSLSTMLASLAAQSQLDARIAGSNARSVPEMWSTHPDPASRVQRAAANARQAGVGGRVNRDQFLAAMDGMLYGDDPRQGVVEGQSFLHPDLRLGFTVPQGFAMQNGTTAVTISGQSGQSQFTTGPYNGDINAYVRAAFQSLARGSNGQQAQLPAFDVRRTTVNGIPAAFATTRANTQQGQVDVTVFAYEFARDRAYHFVALNQAGQARLFDPMFASVRRLSEGEAAAIRPRRLSIVTVRRGDTVQSLASRMAYRDNQLERFLVLNGLSSNVPLTPGQRVKIVVY